MVWQNVIGHFFTKKEWLNSTALVFQLTILVSLLTYYLFRDFFTTIFFGYALTMLLLCILAFLFTLLA
ncbi:MAG: hypothetical protein QXH13_01630, partial [Thermoplasmata archaeon]